MLERWPATPLDHNRASQSDRSTKMTTRRRFIEILPLAGATLLAACSKKEEPAASPATSQAPAPVPVPAPDAATAPAAAAAPTPAPAPAATASAGPVDEKDATAVSLGYVADASRADGSRFKNYSPGQACGNCALFGGKAGDASGPCPIFAGRQVSAKGWCSAHVKKTG